MAALPRPERDPDEASAAAQEVLARPEYADAQRGLVEQTWDRLMEALARALEGAAGTLPGGVAGLAILVLVLGLAAWLLARLVGGTRRQAARDVAAAGHEVGRGPRAWAAEATEAEQAGDWRRAVRCRYRQAVAELAGRALLEEDPGATTGEDLAAVRRRAPDAAEAFAELTRVFEAAWYGAVRVDADDAARVRAAATTVREAADAGAVPRPNGAGGRDGTAALAGGRR